MRSETWPSHNRKDTDVPNGTHQNKLLGSETGIVTQEICKNLEFRNVE
jgi:hypothetical protein